MGGRTGGVHRETAYHIPETVIEYVTGLAPYLPNQTNDISTQQSVGVDVLPADKLAENVENPEVAQRANKKEEGDPAFAEDLEDPNEEEEMRKIAEEEFFRNP